MILLIIFFFVAPVYIFLAYKMDWEHSKKAWQKGIPYSKFDKSLGMFVSIFLFGFGIYLLFSYFNA
ncbi:hypothetical protein GBO31_16060 [Aquimarina litoralis]|nr:hypothetical protein [Aquimarina litoralis]